MAICLDRWSELKEWPIPLATVKVSRVFRIIALVLLGAIIREPGSRRLMASSITNGLNQIILRGTVTALAFLWVWPEPEVHLQCRANAM